MIKRTTAYKSTDGKVFTFETEALTHEFACELESLIKKGLPPNSQDGATPKASAASLMKNRDLFNKLADDFRRALKRAEKRERKLSKK